MTKYKERNKVQYQENSRGYLQYQIPKMYSEQIYGKKQKYISFGAKNSVEAAAEIKAKAKLLQEDLEEGVFNPNDLSRYKYKDKQVKILYQLNKTPATLTEIFEDYTRYRFSGKDEVGEIRYRKDYLPTIQKSPQQNILRVDQQREIAEYIANNICYSYAKSIFSIIDRAIERAKETNQLSKKNPNIFRKYIKEFVSNNDESVRAYPTILTKRGFVKDEEKKAWTANEAKIIIDALRNRKIQSVYYKKLDVITKLIEFLFYTGVRHGEAFGLQWNAISEDMSRIKIRQSYNSKHNLLKTTKTKKVRTIQINLKTQNIITEVKNFYKEIGMPINPTSYVFLSSNNTPLKTSTLHDTWIGSNPMKGRKEKIGIVTGLVIDGKLNDYIDMYSTRRTFISLQAQAGVDPKTVADYVGDNVETILKHYYQGKENYIPTSLF